MHPPNNPELTRYFQTPDDENVIIIPKTISIHSLSNTVFKIQEASMFCIFKFQKRIFLLKMMINWLTLLICSMLLKQFFTTKNMMETATFAWDEAAEWRRNTDRVADVPHRHLGSEARAPNSSLSRQLRTRGCTPPSRRTSSSAWDNAPTAASSQAAYRAICRGSTSRVVRPLRYFDKTHPTDREK